VPEDLRGHDCLNYVFLPSGRPFEWQFERAGERRTAAVAGQLAANDADTLLAAALQGAGIMQAAGYVVDRHLAEARLRRILADWTAPGPTLWYVYPSAKHLSPKVRVFGEFLVALLKNPAVGPTSGSE
jgi:DNA-binding transcriptional LysR family regulator